LHFFTFLKVKLLEQKPHINEFVIPKSILTDEYFDSLQTYPLKKYVQTNTFETANPSTGIPANPTLLWMDAYNKIKNYCIKHKC
jgi:hypothetical protein